MRRIVVQYTLHAARRHSFSRVRVQHNTHKYKMIIMLQSRYSRECIQYNDTHPLLLLLSCTHSRRWRRKNDVPTVQAARWWVTIRRRTDAHGGCCKWVCILCIESDCVCVCARAEKHCNCKRTSECRSSACLHWRCSTAQMLYTKSGFPPSVSHANTHNFFRAICAILVRL